ncbi:hypothetical protein SRABI27_05030 [Pedobacter sp. Bi27]|uniref:hypothetical protein n=1 Tax=Pedobacter sp. Bi27 TaxID=2822351 RepID=UPI001D5DF441|nr:hypothetical protein [Pedobacter sp. Bi27]CAH0316541.1 hypothetical protein SRABI27_05030 [Pedobacter sp. Bi27]
MEEWKLTSYQLPEDGRFVITNVVSGNEIYAEYLAYDSKTNQWHYRSGKLLEEGKRVTGWQKGPGNLING